MTSPSTASVSHTSVRRGVPNARSRRLWRHVGAAFCLLLLLAAAVDRAAAADVADDSYLRGSYSGKPVKSSYMRWDGIYFGASAGYTNMLANFSNSSTVAALGSSTTSSKTYGGFVGYNIQWDELVVGFEGAYNRPVSLASSAQGSTGILIATTNFKVVDYATFRGRAGYAIGQFLPYAFVGGAVARVDYSTDVNGFYSVNRRNGFIGGFAAGLGVDVALLPNVFLRAEWEYLVFTPVDGIQASSNTGRVGVGVRF